MDVGGAEMGQGRGQLSHEERRRIAGLQSEGCSARQIAAALARSPSTIAAELKRNAGADGRYDADEAQAQAQRRARRRRGSRLEHDDALRERVLGMLGQGLSPEQVAGRLNREAGRTVISYETIYRFIYDQMARTKDDRWARLLPRGHTRRQRR